MSLDLESPGGLAYLSEKLKNDIDAHIVKKYSTGHRSHLGASQIGRPCSRELWYGFRWVYYKIETAQQYRLFQRGHFEEPRFTEYLTDIGCEVTCFDDANLHEQDKGKRQIRISDCKGHFGGSIDAKIKLPAHYNITQDVLFLGEYKTQGTQKFAKLVEKGVQIDKYQHFCQQSIYGLKLGLQYAIYIAVDKNNDNLHLEVVKLDWTLGRELESKAEKIIFSQEPPAKISASPDFFECRWCSYRSICWHNHSIEVSCRSCMRAQPVDNAEWMCNLHGAIIPKEFIRKGCGDWVGIV